jgi:hypothetical protein
MEMRVIRLFQTHFLKYWKIELVLVGALLLVGCSFPAGGDLPACLPEELAEPATLLNPSDNEVISTLSPTFIFDWGSDCNPQEFLLEVFNPTSDQPAIISQRVTGTSRGWAMGSEELQPGSTYSWRVTPYLDGSPGATSSTNIFITGPICMDPFAAEYPAPALLSPPDGTVISELNPIRDSGGTEYPNVSIQMAWDDPSDCNPEGYLLQVSTLPSFPSGATLEIPQPNWTRTLFFFPPDEETFPFQDCTTYYWRVRAILSETEYGPWSDTWSFFVTTGTVACLTDPVVTPAIPLLPPPTSKAPKPPSQEDQQGSEEDQQNEQEGCWIVDNQHPNGYCAPKTCGPNDYPGTSCTP